MLGCRAQRGPDATPERARVDARAGTDRSPARVVRPPATAPQRRPPRAVRRPPHPQRQQRTAPAGATAAPAETAATSSAALRGAMDARRRRLVAAPSVVATANAVVLGGEGGKPLPRVPWTTATNCGVQTRPDRTDRRRQATLVFVASGRRLHAIDAGDRRPSDGRSGRRRRSMSPGSADGSIVAAGRTLRALRR